MKKADAKQDEQARKMNQVIARCWSDASFKKKLLADPEATLKAAGIDGPPGMSVKAHENTDKVFHLVIPAKPKDMSDADLDSLSAGKYDPKNCNRDRCMSGNTCDF